MRKNILIIHYNTPKLTECLVKSINKFVDGAIIYILDNSNRRPFKAKFDNVTILDNTNGQIIDFDKWLKKYPNRDKSPGRINKWGSAKHAYSVERCMEILNQPFILLDSDILLKKDISSLFMDDMAYCGEVVNQPKSIIKRVIPYVCWINTPMIKENGSSYFDGTRMHGLWHSKNGDYYDTGASFYLSTVNLNHKEINWEDYAVHYGHGSWKKPGQVKPLTQEQWLTANKRLWSSEEKKEQPTKTVTNKLSKNTSPKPKKEIKKVVQKLKKPERKATTTKLKTRKTQPERIGFKRRGNQLNYY